MYKKIIKTCIAAEKYFWHFLFVRTINVIHVAMKYFRPLVDDKIMSIFSVYINSKQWVSSFFYFLVNRHTWIRVNIRDIIRSQLRNIRRLREQREDEFNSCECDKTHGPGSNTVPLTSRTEIARQAHRGGAVSRVHEACHNTPFFTK